MIALPDDRDARTQFLADADAIGQVIAPLLAGRGNELQGWVLAELVSVWLIGHHPSTRPDVLANWLNVLHQLADVNEATAARHLGRPLHRTN